MTKHIFRGKCIDDSREFNGKWVYGDLIHSDGKTYIHPQSNAVSVEMGLGRLIVMHEVDPDTVGVNTELVDGDGFPIYEGDVVEFESHGYIPGTDIGVVKFKDGCYGIEYLPKWCREHGWDSLFHRIGKTEEWRDMGASGTITYTYCVLGNIHDNPEFLDMWEESERR